MPYTMIEKPALKGCPGESQSLVPYNSKLYGQVGKYMEVDMMISYNMNLFRTGSFYAGTTKCI